MMMMMMMRIISENDLFGELYGTLRLGKKFRNFLELYNGYDGAE